VTQDLFTSAKSVFRRANHHITNLKSEINVSTPDKPYSYTVDVESDGTTQKHKFKFSESFSDDIACIMFDAINNLRSCLDQMTHAIARKHRGPSKNFAYFPICRDRVHWANRIKGMKNDLPAEIASLFEYFQPYKGGNDALWAVNYMANIKKHDVLIPVDFGRAVLWESSPGNDTIIHKVWDKNEIEFTTPGTDFGRNREFSFSIVVRDAEEVVNDKSPVTLLDAMSREVERVLVGTEAECRRIGLIP